MNNQISTQGKKPSNLIQTITRVSAILDVLAQDSHGMSLGELAVHVNLPKGTTHRLLSSLMYYGFIRQDTGTRKYSLGFRLVELGSMLLNHIDLRKEAEPFLKELAKKTMETVYLVVLDGAEVVYIDKVESHDYSTELKTTSKLGQRHAANNCAVGKMLLSQLPDEELSIIMKQSGFIRKTKNTIVDRKQFLNHLQMVHAQGYAVDDEENEEGIRCIAAPIRNGAGRAIAAISVSGPSIRVTRERINKSLINEILQTSLCISQKMGFRELGSNPPFNDSGTIRA